ncbi:MAG: hypothetical protein NC409_11070 [Clostridium sp.]|nr:hypothetical protein [Clostridium sp.]
MEKMVVEFYALLKIAGCIMGICILALIVWAVFMLVWNFFRSMRNDLDKSVISVDELRSRLDGLAYVRHAKDERYKQVIDDIKNEIKFMISEKGR